MTTVTVTIPADEQLRHLHSIARRNHLSVEIVDMGESDSALVAAGRQAPYRWRLTVSRAAIDAPDGRRPVFSIAFERARELPAAVREAWQAFVRWGIV